MSQIWCLGKVEPLSQSALVTRVWKWSGFTHGMGLLLQEKAQRDRLGICVESHTAERTPLFLISKKINQTVQTAEKLFAL